MGSNRRGGKSPGARAKGVCIPKEQHRRDPTPGIFEREAGLAHAVLLYFSPAQVVHGARGIDFGFKGPRRVGILRPAQDVEIIVRRVATGVAFRPYRGAENDEVFRDAFSGGVSLV